MTLPWDIPTEREIEWLLDHGISEAAMLEPTPIRAANVVFLDGDTFDFDACGIRAFVFKELDSDDLVAWRPASKRLPDCLATWRGVAFALGQDAIWNPASYFMGSALRVHADPLAWLRSGRDGICIVQPSLAYGQLRHVPRLSFADPMYARQVQQLLQPPKPKAEILIEVPAERAAA
jgi:hypothetical protein